ATRSTQPCDLSDHRLLPDRPSVLTTAAEVEACDILSPRLLHREPMLPQRYATPRPRRRRPKNIRGDRETRCRWPCPARRLRRLQRSVAWPRLSIELP